MWTVIMLIILFSCYGIYGLIKLVNIIYCEKHNDIYLEAPNCKECKILMLCERNFAQLEQRKRMIEKHFNENE